jgi:aminoglycoside/choline kinase family phosphotransferase
MLMDAPPPQEDVRPFLAIARRLTAFGYSAPEILAEDAAAGFLLLEDLGDTTYTRALAAGAPEADLYRRAVDLLVDLHRHPAADLAAGVAPYDDARLEAEIGLFLDWYLPAVDGVPADAAEAFRALWRDLYPLGRRVPETLVLRDYHVDNLMVLPRQGHAAVGLLDFQDALRGSVAYDLVSLLADARRDVTPALAQELHRHYAAAAGLDRGDLSAAAAMLSAQRNLKILGIFTRLDRRDGKPRYLAHIPRVWRLLENDVTHPALGAVRAWLDRHLPPQHRGIPARAAAESRAGAGA